MVNVPYTMGMKAVFTLAVTALLLPFSASAEDVNAGFVQGLWYSKEPVFADTPNRIYVALRNSTPHDLSGTVRFTVDDVRIGSSEIRALSGRLVEAWVDWTPKEGTHTVSAFVSDARLHIIGEGVKTIDVAGMRAEDSLTIEYDTDGDGIGNSLDEDDDGDGASDEDEQARGTDPLRANATPQNKEDEKRDEHGEDRRATGPADRTRGGLERFVGSGTVDTALSSLTAKIVDSKNVLDEYRTERNERIAEESAPGESAISGGTATITRSRINTDQSLLSAFVSGTASLVASVWTLALWVASRALSYPALIELLLLLGILYGIYRMARRFGRRQY